jgi:hypothetical protein
MQRGQSFTNLARVLNEDAVPEIIPGNVRNLAQNFGVFQRAQAIQFAQNGGPLPLRALVQAIAEQNDDEGINDIVARSTKAAPAA